MNTWVEAATRLAAVGAAAHGEADHPAEVGHLLRRRGVTGMVGELRVEHPLDGRVPHEQVDDGSGVAAMAVHPHGERLDAAQDEVAVERRGNRAGGVLHVAQSLGELVVVDGDDATDDVAVAAEVLRRRVDDDVGAEGEWLLEIRRGERVVDDDQGTVLVGHGGDGLDVDAAEQRVGRRLQPHERGVGRPGCRQGVDVGEVDGAPGEAERAPHVGDQPVGAAVRVVAEEDPPAGNGEAAQHRVLRCQSAGEGESVVGLLERSHALFERRARRVARARVLVALVHAD